MPTRRGSLDWMGFYETFEISLCNIMLLLQVCKLLLRVTHHLFQHLNARALLFIATSAHGNDLHQLGNAGLDGRLMIKQNNFAVG